MERRAPFLAITWKKILHLYRGKGFQVFKKTSKVGQGCRSTSRVLAQHAWSPSSIPVTIESGCGGKGIKSSMTFSTTQHNQDLRRMHEAQNLRNALMAKSTWCSCREPEFNSKHHMVAHNACNSSFRRHNTLFWPLWIPGVHVVPMKTYTRSKYTHKEKLGFLKETLSQKKWVSL